MLEIEDLVIINLTHQSRLTFNTNAYDEGGSSRSSRSTYGSNTSAAAITKGDLLYMDNGTPK
jgi:hypothetical protein